MGLAKYYNRYLKTPLLKEEKPLKDELHTLGNNLMEELKRLRNAVKISPDYMTVTMSLQNAYRSIKDSRLFLDNDILSTRYQKPVLVALWRLESFGDSLYICDTNALFNYQKDLDYVKTNFDKKQKKRNLETIVMAGRYFLYKKRTHSSLIDENSKKEFNKLDLADECLIASQEIKNICDKLGIKCYAVSIDAGLSKYANLLDGCGYHFFNIVTIDNKKYIVDITYKQFFKLRDNLLERLGIIGLPGCKPGIYMILNEERKKVAKQLLYEGFIELTDSNLKSYLEGFALSYCNGLYFENQVTRDYTLPFTVDDYIDFLNGDYSMIDHIDKDMLCIQKKPLKNPRFKF